MDGHAGMDAQEAMDAKGKASDAEILTGAEIVLRALADQGVDTIFGYPGGAVLPIYDALHGETRIRHVLVRHEQAAVHAAEGYARTTGKPGVVLVTSGPGMSNTTTGLLDALSDSIPVVCISGQVAKALIGTDAFQECDALGISRSVTKWNVQIREAAQVEPLVRKAFEVATQGRPGPVLVDFPKDLQLAPVTGLEAPAAPSVRRSAERKSLPRQRLAEAALLLKRAERPVFYGGGGLINSGVAACQSFARLVERTNAPCTLTLMGLTGAVNNAVFRGFQAGEVLFLGAGGSRRGTDPDDRWEISYKFAASPNQTGMAVGSIAGIQKRGWDYLWVQYGEDVDATAKVLIKKPIAVYVEQVYPIASFAGLGIGS